MEIEETINKDLSIESIDDQHKADPNIPNPLLQPPFSLLVVAPKGGGKSTFIINCLVKKNMYRRYFDKIIVFSPTWKLDPKMSKSIDLPDDQIYPEYDDELLRGILDAQDQHIQEVGKADADRLLFIFDDMIQSDAFKNRRNAMDKLYFNIRHYNASLIVSAQRYRGVPLNFRVNVSGLALFNIPNQKEIGTIIEENSGTVNKEDFKHIYDYCMRKPFNFMYINFQKHHSKMFNSAFNPLKITKLIN